MKKEELTPDEVLDFEERKAMRIIDAYQNESEAEREALREIEERRERREILSE